MVRDSEADFLNPIILRTFVVGRVVERWGFIEGFVLAFAAPLVARCSILLPCDGGLVLCAARDDRRQLPILLPPRLALFAATPSRRELNKYQKLRDNRGVKEEEMVVRIRLSRLGCRNKPFYRVMAADSRSPRDGKHLEVLGYYNPLPVKDGGKRMGLNFDRVKYWLSVGAQPSEPVQRLLFRAGLLPPPPMLAMARKGGPRDTRPVDPMTGKYLPLDSSEAAIEVAGSEDGCSDDEAKS